MNFLNQLIETLPTISDRHAPSESLYRFLNDMTKAEILSHFGHATEPVAKSFGPFGDIIFPYRKMGAIDSLDLFGLDELIIFSFYWANRKRYHSVLDIGANIGLHSIVLDRCGYNAKCFEPDPVTFGIQAENFARNKVKNVAPIRAAVSFREGTAKFIRVLGNTTGSHLAGAKSNPYGDLETFEVNLVHFGSALEGVDLVKMDVEGHEKDILLATERHHWEKTDLLVEVGTLDNAKAIYQHFKELDISLFAQKINWRRVLDVNDMPTSYKDGTLFATSKAAMPWATN